MNFLPLDVQRDWHLIEEVIGCALTNDTRGIIAVSKSGIQAAVVLNCWTDNSAQCHWFIKSPMVIRHGFIEVVCEYFFEQCGRKVLIGVVPSDNDAALKLNEHVGFREVARIPEAFSDGVDSVIMQANREDLARWVEDGQEEYARSA